MKTNLAMDNMGVSEMLRNATPHLKEARELIPIELLEGFKELRPRWTLIVTALIWIQLLSAWGMALCGSTIFLIPAFIMICASISAMQLWVHESSHYNLFNDRRLNDIWATIFFSSPIGMSVKIYRRYHMTHHARMGTSSDMDRFAFNVNVKGIRNLALLVLKGLTCVNGLKIVLSKYSGKDASLDNAQRDLSMVFTLIWNILLFGACIVAGRWYLYFLLWAYPILGIAVTINSLRSVSEHQPIDFMGPVLDGQSISPVIRTTLPSPFEKWMMFQSNFNYHFEHHLYPTVPAANLPLLHKYLDKKGFYKKYPEIVQRSAVTKVLNLSKMQII